MLNRLSRHWGRLLEWLALAGCVLLLLLMLLICADVLLRNLPAGSMGGMRGIPASNDLSEYALYLITMLSAPWLLRQGQHIRVDILLRVLPRRLAWLCEWLADLLGLACCVVMAWIGTKAALASYVNGAMTFKTLVTPEWWSIAPLPITFMLLAVEMLFRMQRLAQAERGPRDDAVSSA